MQSLQQSIASLHMTKVHFLSRYQSYESTSIQVSISP